MSNTEVFAALFSGSLAWRTFDENDWLAFCGAGEDAAIAEDAAGRTWVRSVEDGIMAIEVFDEEMEVLWAGQLSGAPYADGLPNTQG